MLQRRDSATSPTSRLVIGQRHLSITSRWTVKIKRREFAGYVLDTARPLRTETRNIEYAGAQAHRGADECPKSITGTPNEEGLGQRQGGEQGGGCGCGCKYDGPGGERDRRIVQR